jgi:hypothetical protein
MVADLNLIYATLAIYLDQVDPRYGTFKIFETWKGHVTHISHLLLHIFFGGPSSRSWPLRGNYLSIELAAHRRGYAGYVVHL